MIYYCLVLSYKRLKRTLAEGIKRFDLELCSRCTTDYYLELICGSMYRHAAQFIIHYFARFSYIMFIIFSTFQFHLVSSFELGVTFLLGKASDSSFPYSKAGLLGCLKRWTCRDYFQFYIIPIVL